MKTKHFLATIGLLLTLGAPAAALEYNTVLVGGRPDGDPLGPELGPGVDWTSSIPFRWYMNEAGQIAFAGRLSGATAASDTGVWRWSGDAKELLAREDQQVPALPSGVQFDELNSLFGMSIGGDGSVMFSGFLKGPAVGPGSNSSYLLANADGTLTVIAREGNQAAGGLNAFYQPEEQLTNPIFQHSLSAPLLSPDGQILVDAQIVGPGISNDNNRLLYLGTPGNLQVIAREGGPAPNVTSGATYGSTLGRTNFANGGQQIFSTIVNNPDSSSNQVLYRHNAGTFTAIATDESPSGIAGLTFREFISSQVNASGHVAFTAQYAESPHEGLYKAQAGSGNGVFQLLAAPGVPAPGTGALFGANPSFSVSNALATSGDVAFLYDLSGAGVTGDNDRGIWIHDDGGTRLAFREGESAGSLSGVTIGTFGDFTFNDNQNLIVISDLVGAVADGDNRAMWLVHPDGELELLLREGDLFDVDPSAGVDNRTIANFRLGGYLSDFGVTNWYGAFNDSDQLAFGLNFTDGHSGLFVTDVTPVPEPSSVTLAGLAAVVLAGARRRRV